MRTRLTRGVLTSHRATRVAFVVIIVFVTAQMGWWIYFMSRYVADVSANKIAGLEREAEALNLLLEQGAAPRVSAALAEQPYLHLVTGGRGVEVEPQALGDFLADQRRVIRMLAFEGPFFVLVVMAGLFVIARNLRAERELKRRQRNFLDAIGHEYKTPVSTLRLLIETMQIRALAPEKLQSYLHTMSLEVDRLERTGEQVLATARLEAGAEVSARGGAELTTLIADVLEGSRHAYEARGARLNLHAAGEPLPVEADPDDVATILENLVDNAIKYTPGPTKPVDVHLDRQGDWARLRVVDAGSGVPEGERTRVFERFYRVGNELTRTAPGLGLGLYLVGRVAASLGGRVRLDAGEGGGTVVTVLLPLSEPGAHQVRPAGAGAAA